MTTQLGKRKEVAQARADIYRFLARLYGNPPTAELMAALAEPAYREHLETVFGEVARPFLEAVAAKPDLEALRREYDALFRVPGERYLRPYESVYRGRRVVKGQVVDGRVWNSWTKEVQRVYAAAGLEPNRSAGELPDFIATELEFVSLLCAREAEAWATGDQGAAQRFSALQESFLVEHLSRWADDLCTTMAAQAREAFYIGLADITKAFLLADLQHMQAEHGA